MAYYMVPRFIDLRPDSDSGPYLHSGSVIGAVLSVIVLILFQRRQPARVLVEMLEARCIAPPLAVVLQRCAG